MPTGDLMELMVRLGLYVNRKFALEVAKREDAIFHLRKLVQNGYNWSKYITNAGWAPIHAIFILALIKNQQALDLLLDLVRYKEDDLGDWLTEDVTALFVAFGEPAIDKLKEFATDETLEHFVRSSATTALATLAKKFPAHESDIKTHLVNLLKSTGDAEFAGLIVDDIASFHDMSVLPEIHKAFKEERIDESFVTEADINEMIKGAWADKDKSDFERSTKDPLSHFSRDSIERLHAIQMENEESDKEDDGETEDEEQSPFDDAEPKPKKIGRNDPCPCGSGKKFKKCCMWGGGGRSGAAA